MFLSVIIPTCNRNDLLGKCLDCFAHGRQTVDDSLYEVIVTDDGKNSQAKELISNNYPWAKWVEGPKKGPAANRNNGAQYAKGEWLIFIDDDVLPDNNILRSYKMGIEENTGCLAFEGSIYPDDWNSLSKDMMECPVNINGGVFWSANICVSNGLFKLINGFDDRFLIAAQEDQDIYENLKLHTNVVFLKDAKVIHPVRKVSLLAKVRRIPQDMQNWFQYEEKYNPDNLDRTIVGNIRKHLYLALIEIKKFHLKKSLYNVFCSFYGIIFFFKKTLLR